MYEKAENFSLIEVLSFLVSKLRYIVYTSLLFAFISAIVSLSINNKYTSSAIVKISDNQYQGNSFLSSSPQIGGLASFAGISIPGSENDPTEYVIKTIQSRNFLKHLLTFKDIDINLVAAESYNFSKNQITYNKELYDIKDQKWIRKPQGTKKTIPSHLEIYNDFYSKNLRVSKDKSSGFIRISYEHISPTFAKDFLDLVIEQINEVARKKDISSSEKIINFFEVEKQNIMLNSVDKIINEILEEQFKILSFANAKEEYLIERIEYPFAPEIKSSPKRIAITILGGLIGAISSLLFYLIQNFYRNMKNL